MTNEEVKAEFRKYLPAKAALDSARRTIKQVNDTAGWIKSAVVSGLPNGRVSDPVADAICKLHRAADQLLKSAGKYEATMLRAEELLNMADDLYGQAVIRMRWFEDIGFDFIPAKVNLCRRSMFEHYEQAIDEISKKTESLH